MNNQKYSGINQTLQGFYKTLVVDGVTNDVVWEQKDWQKNLILNQGMDAVYSQYLVDLIKFAAAGQGSRPNTIDSNTSQITQSGNLIHLSVRTGVTDFTSSVGSYTPLVSAGDSIVDSDMSESVVVSVVDGYNLSVSTNYTYTTGKTFTVWKTTQVGLQNEVKRAGNGILGSSYFTTPPYCGTVVVDNVKTHRRTYDFSTESIQTTYNEVGVGWTSSFSPTTIFSRILLNDPIVIDAGQKLRVIYDFVNTFTPSGSINKTPGIGGWPVSPSTTTLGTESIQNFLTSIVSANGLSDTSSAVLDPSFVASSDGNIQTSMFASSNTQSLSSFGTGTARSLNVAYSVPVMTKTSYTAGSYVCDKTAILDINQIPRTDIRSIGLGTWTLSPASYPYASGNNAIVFLFNENQSKSSIQTLSFTYRWTWSRILS